ncbi:hypothetical protein KVR01_000119 [Diaporthe batatas]|uniref:uncharacterized protein n=1 Tax=Diaporthe batatas TaxID=748121 RepID=UPI001D0427CE|nr:uncharacterized protein KVR01_000119 [Diaporthe batatas]KAG8169374.1 hypothetical protein KVR01_000119 [Diaporthe batatas]
MSKFSQAPHKVGGLAPFTFSISKEELDDLNTLLKRPFPAVWESSSQENSRYGVTHEWFSNAISQWKNYDWQKYQDSINGVPNFKVPVEDDGETYNIHFAALFSQNKNATPLLLSHGWPGSFLEFLPILNKVQKQYASDPASLPYHLIVPSLPGYGLTKISANKNITMEICSRILNKLMVKLGFNQYIAQGGDVGSMVTKMVVEEYEECIAGHTNMLTLNPPEGDVPKPTQTEQEALDRSATFWASGSAYALLHGTKPSTAGFAIGSSPQALLAWIGEKMIDWSDETPSVETILGNVSLYWFTGCYPTSIWPYRQIIGPDAKDRIAAGSMDKVNKPFGYSWFPMELGFAPKSWADATGKVSFYRAHDKGGHFAALEVPDVLWQDIVEFVDYVNSTRK